MGIRLGRLRPLLLIIALTVVVGAPLVVYAGGAGGGGNKANVAVQVKNISTGPSSGSVAQPLVTIDTREVGDALNAPTSVGGTSVGSVTAAFRMGTFEVTIAQYVAFLNAVATRTDGANGSIVESLYDSRMASDLNVAGIARAGLGTSGDPFVYSPIGDSRKPLAYVTWFNAARFANWMHNGATQGGDTETGAYTLALATSGTFLRNANAVWWIPSQDEWFKAAYYKSGSADAGYWRYPTQSDDFPTNDSSSGTNQANFQRLGLFSITQGTTLDTSLNYLTSVGTFANSPSAYGTFDQGGNLDEWTDSVVSTSFGDARITRGGGWNSGGLNNDVVPISTALPSDRLNKLGFRLARTALTSSGTVSLTGDFDVAVGSSTTGAPQRINAGLVGQFSVRRGSFTITIQDSANPTVQESKQFSTGNARINRITISNVGGRIAIEQLPAGANF